MERLECGLFPVGWGDDQSVFACEGWPEMLGALSLLYAEEGTSSD